ncbi:VOC family protein [Carnobacterium sp. TMP28]|uniref:VOC family protein n=1 Tax=Carnobacterium sp. TMP28 TaxID=3397060 RepID=UPI0039DFDA25
MKIEHVAIWSPDIEKLKAFYATYFSAVATDRYQNNKTGFTSYFLTFKEGARLEIMHKKNILPVEQQNQEYLGYAHLAMSVGTKSEVTRLTNQLRKDGYHIVGEPRTTGDGYFESVILDPDGNRIEITC